MADDPIAGSESFGHDRDDEEELLQVPFDSDSNGGSNGEAKPVTKSQPSMTQPVMTQFQEHP